jgi:hypothetical protein
MLHAPGIAETGYVHKRRCLCGAVIEHAKSKGFDFPDG